MALAAAVPLAQTRIDRLRPLDGSERELLYMWTGDQVKYAAPGFETVLADLYWLRTVQYFGGERVVARRELTLLGPLIDITVRLDPRMEIAYRYGSVFLAEPPPMGAGQPREAIALLERGSKALPESWRIRQDLGFFHFLFLRDAHQASRVLTEAADLTGAPIWLRNLAADVLAKGQDRQTALRMWREIRQQTEGAMRHNAQVQIWVLEAQEQADSLTRSVDRFREKVGRRPRSLDELWRYGWIEGQARDMTGMPFDYDESTGRVEVSKGSRLWQPEQ